MGRNKEYGTTWECFTGLHRWGKENSMGQTGVEAGKVYTSQILKH